LGEVVYNSHTVIGKPLSYYWKMIAIESIQSSAGLKLARGDMQLLIENLIDNHQVRDILLKSLPNTEGLGNEMIGSQEGHSTGKELSPSIA
jgi:hypothetical protein